MPIELTKVVNIVVGNQVALIDILGARSVAREQDAGVADVVDFTAGDFDPTAIEVQPYARTAGITKSAVFY